MHSHTNKIRKYFCENIKLTVNSFFLFLKLSPIKNNNNNKKLLSLYKNKLIFNSSEKKKKFKRVKRRKYLAT